eukprot:761685-Hanusia_phi.AAC.1
MGKNIYQKKDIIKQVSEDLASSQFIFSTEMKQITVPQVRQGGREAGSVLIALVRSASFAGVSLRTRRPPASRTVCSRSERRRREE